MTSFLVKRTFSAPKLHKQTHSDANHRLGSITLLCLMLLLLLSIRSWWDWSEILLLVLRARSNAKSVISSAVLSKPSYLTLTLP